MTKRLLLIGGLTLLVFALRAIPTSPVPPAQASVCSLPVISTACNVVSNAYQGVTWTLNRTTGAVTAGGKLVGTIMTSASNLAGKLSNSASTFICDKLSVRVTTNLCRWLIKQLGAKVVAGNKPATSPTTAAPPSSSGSSATSTATSTQSSTPSDSPQSYLRTSAIAAGAAAAVGSVAHAVSRGTAADVEAPWFQGLYGRAAAYAAAIALLALVCALAEGGIRGDGALVMEAFRAVPFAAVMTFAASSIIALALAAVDDAGQLIAGPSLHDATNALHVLAGLFVALGLAAKGAAASGHASIARIAAFPAAMFSIFGVVGAGLVALELLLRDVAIYAGVLFLPLALAARIWPRLAHGAARLGHTLLALILSKLVLVLTLGLAATAILHGGGTGLVTGAGALLVTGLAPALLYGIFALADHRFHRGALPAPVSPTSAADRMAAIIAWQTERADRGRGAYYEARPQLESPVSPAGGQPPSSPPPPSAPPPSPTPPPSPGGRTPPRPNAPSAQEDVDD